LARFQPPNPFELENLEPRILLSGDPLVGLANTLAPGEPDLLETGLELPPIEESIPPGAGDSQSSAYQQTLQYDPSQNLTDIFAGLQQEDAAADAPADLISDATETLPEGINTDTGDAAALSDRHITPEETPALIQGLSELANLGRVLEDYEAFAAPLPLTEGATLGRLLGPYEILDTRLAKPVYDYFSDATDPPTTDGLVAVLQQLSGTADLIVTADDVSGGYDEVFNEIRFSLNFHATRRGEVFLNADSLADELGIQFAEDAEVEYLSEIIFDFTFGLEAGEGQNGFFVEVDQLTASLAVDADRLEVESVSTASPTSFVSADGELDLNARIDVRFDETIAADGRITLAELRGITPETIEDFVDVTAAGTLVAALTLETDSGNAGQNGLALHVDIKSDNLFAGAAPGLSVRVDISILKDPILDLLKGLNDVGEVFAFSGPATVALPVIDTAIHEMLAGDTDSASGKFLNFYQPAFEYFSLLEAFNFDLNVYASAIGALPGIDQPDFNISLDAHRLKLKNLIEKETNLTLQPDWDLSLYLPEIWSLFNPDFQINDYLPKFQALLGLPYVPAMDQVRSDLKSYFGAFPSLKGLLDYIRTTGLKSVFNGFGGELASEPFTLNGEYLPQANAIRLDFFADAAKPIDLTLDLGTLLADEFDELGMSLGSNPTVSVTLGVKLDFSAAVSGQDASLTVRQAAVTVQVNEDIDGLTVAAQDMPDANQMISGGRFDFDARVELIFHGLDPPSAGT